ncbi:MAG: PQQ-dependent dehydrogenase, methanol/ethanol family [Pseudomonadota bacterium]
MKAVTTSALLVALTLIIISCTQPSVTADRSASDRVEKASNPALFADVDGAQIVDADAVPGEWLSYGRTYDEQRYSPLDEVNLDTVGGLGVAWTYDLATGRGVESTPIVVDGVMYVTSAWSIVYALDAKTGEELWVHDPKVDRSFGVKACCDVVNRGVAVWKGRIHFGTIDGRLVAVDAKTGDLVWQTVTVDQTMPYTITGAPRVVKDKVLIGNGGAELGVRGYLSAYDSADGELVWRFYTAPNPNKEPDGAASDRVFAEFANDTWGDEGKWKEDGGGGTVWDSIVYDSENDSIIFGVGNASPWQWNLRDPSGKDNLFVSSIVAVDADSGDYKWHFQTTPGDSWDYTATQTLILANLPLGEDDAYRRVVMQAPKNGYFYVIDAATGEFLSGNNFVPQNWTTGLDANGRPNVVPDARDQSQVFLQTPGPLGGHNWHPMSFNPDLNLAYIPAQEIPQAYIEDPRFAARSTKWNTGLDFAAGLVVDIPDEVYKALRATLKGRLIAWDPIAQEPRWSVEHSNAWNGGTLTTAGGLVFQGQLSGEFAAYNAATGEKLWSANVKSGAASGPATFAIDGVQYVTITTGWGSAFSLLNGFAFDQVLPPTVGKVVTFKLGGKQNIADPQQMQIARTPKADPFGDTPMIEEGMVHYARNCMVCHGIAAISTGVLPDLRWSEVTGDESAWNGVVLDGALAGNGMVSFSDVLSEADATAIRAYVLHQSHKADEVLAGQP